MNAGLLIGVLSLCLLLAGAETLHGIARTVLVVPRIGRQRALKLSALTGSLLAFVICLLRVPSLGLETGRAHLLLGAGLAAFMAAFDLAIGRFLMRKAWQRLWPDFNPASGNYLLYGLLFLCVAPWLVHALRR